MRGAENVLSLTPQTKLAPANLKVNRDEQYYSDNQNKDNPVVGVLI
jgi:hypothetical protein